MPISRADSHFHYLCLMNVSFIFLYTLNIMLPKPTCLKWIIVFVLLLMMPLAYAGNLHWQPESWQTEYYELKVSFNARDHHDKTGRQSDPLTITGRPGQLLLACSRLRPERTEGLAVQVVNDEYQVLALNRQQASLDFDSVEPCSPERLSEYPYQWRQTLVSDEPFLVWQEPGKQRHRRHPDKALECPWIYHHQPVSCWPVSEAAVLVSTMMTIINPRRLSLCRNRLGLRLLCYRYFGCCHCGMNGGQAIYFPAISGGTG